MPAQSSISSLMPLSPKTGAVRARSGGADDGFSRLMESSPRTEPPPAANRTGASSLREAHAAGDGRTATHGEAGNRGRGGESGASGENGWSRENGESGKRSNRLASSARTETSRTGERAGPNAAGDTETSRGKVEPVTSEALDSESAIEEARSLLAGLSDGDWDPLTENVRAVLEELNAQASAGNLDPSLEASLRDLLADLEAGAPLESIVQQLQAMPLDQLPSLAARFPEARTLGDLLGKSGAAYLTQLAAIAGNTGGKSPIVEAATMQTLASAGETDKLDLNALMEAGKQGARTPRQEFGWLMNELAKAQSGAPKTVEPGASATAASNAAQLDTSARPQPVAASDRQFTVQSEVRVPVGQSQWGQAVGQRVLWMASQKLSSAELRLDPPDLGPMQVRVSSHQDQISVTFTSPQTAVREALDQNANRLRDMFAEQGLDLVDVNVSDQSGGDASGDGGEAGNGRGGHGSEETDGPVVEQWVSDRLVDHYA